MKKIILLLLFGILLMSFVYAETFTPIFCNDYEFTCCGGKVDSTNSYSVSDEIPWTCPQYAYKCEVLSSGGKDYWVGSINCRLDTGIYDIWKCDDEQKYKSEMTANDQVYLRNGMFNVEGNIEVKIIKSQLGFCGRSGSVGEEVTCGVPVSGADGCQFNPIDGKVYTSTSSLNGLVNAAHYTVPMATCVLAFQTGDRHICGYKEESCSSNSDCSGHTYGDKECNGRTLQTYGCISYGSQMASKDRGPFDSGWGTDKSQPMRSGDADFGKRCEIIQSSPVQCCGDNDCGANYFCDKSTFTCKENVECHQNSDCGVSIQCDWTTNTLKNPSCDNGKCKFNEVKVDCCNDKNCQEGGYCSENHKCLNSQIKQTSSNQSKDGGITGNAIGSSGKTSLWIVGVLVLAGVGIVVYLLRKKSGHAERPNTNCCEESRKAGKKFCVQCGKELIEAKKSGKKKK